MQKFLMLFELCNNDYFADGTNYEEKNNYVYLTITFNDYMYKSLVFK